jgi:hypothetical protein
MSKPLKIVGTMIHSPVPVAEAQAERGVQEQLQVSIEVENPNDKPLHVWASRRAYDYDASTHVLSIHLAETPPALPPGIQMLSDHPRTPVQVAVNPKSRATIKVPIPATIRRRVPGAGLGMSFVEEPIGQIDKVDLQVQYADEPARHIPKESPIQHRKRLMKHGQVAVATITPTKPTKQKEK